MNDANFPSALIGIAGAGGLGSNIAVNLVRCGHRRLRVVDFDVVEPSNLNRQFYFSDQVGVPKVRALEVNLRRIAPDLCLETLVERITPQRVQPIFEGCDIVVEAFDGATEKAWFVAMAAGLGVPVVAGSGVAGRFLSGIRKQTLGPVVVLGDLESDVALHPLKSYKVSCVAAHMCEAIETLLGVEP